MKIKFIILGLCMVFCMSGCDPGDKRGLAALERLEQELRQNSHNQVALNQLLIKAGSKNAIIRGNAIGFLGLLARDHPNILNSVLPVLIHKLERGDPWDQRIAAERLVDLASEKTIAAIPALIKGLQAGDSDVAWFSAEALGNYGSIPQASNAVSALAKALKLRPPLETQEEAPQLRVFAARALRKIGSSNPDECLPALRIAMTNENPFFALEAAKAVQAIDPKDVESIAIIKAIGTRQP